MAAGDKEPLSRSPSYQATCRRVRDCCAVLHNAKQKWAGLNDTSSAVANKLVNIITQGSYDCVGVVNGNEELRKRMEGKLLEEREQLYLNLKNYLLQMVTENYGTIIIFNRWSL